MSHEYVGLIGMGLLGTALAERMRAAGLDVLGFDLDPARGEWLRQSGGRVAASAVEVAAACRRIVLSLPDGDVAAAVIGQIRPSLKAGTLLVDTTTGDPDTTAALAKSLLAGGVAYVDATIVGSSEHARAGNAQVLAGGRDEDLSAARPLLECWGREVVHVGPAGSGARMKLVANLVMGLNRAALAEGLTLARSLGLDAEQALAVLRGGLAYSRVMDTKGRKMIDEDFAPRARLSQHLKDVRLMLAAARRTGTTLPLSQVHEQLLETAQRRGYGQADNSAVIKALDS